MNAINQLESLEGKQADLFTWLFGSNDRLNIVRGKFNLLRDLSSAKPGDLDGSDVRVYCSDERLKWKHKPNTKSPWKCHDPHTNSYFTLKDRVSCKLTTLAITHNPNAGQQGFPAAVSFCPWYLEYEQQKKYGSLADTQLSSLSDRVAKFKLGEWPFPSPDMDFLRLLDATVIHELTHTTHAGDLDDVKYGWKGCREISTRTGDAREDKGPLWNADTFGLFAAGSWYLNMGGNILETGGIFPNIPNEPNEPDESDESDEPNEFDGPDGPAEIAEAIAGRVRIGGQQLVEGQ